MKTETFEIYEERRLAKSDDPLSKSHRTRICVACGSKDTIIIYNDYNARTDNEGWFSKQHIREFICKTCGKYYMIEVEELYRKFYTRGS